MTSIKDKMQKDEDDAVSPVIGVVLMVAVVVVLAAIIGSSVFGLGQTSDTSPRAGLTFSEVGNGDVEIVVNSAQRLDSINFSVSPADSSTSVSDLDVQPVGPGDVFYYCGGQEGDSIVATGTYEGVSQVLQQYQLREGGSGGSNTLQEDQCS